MMKHDNFFSCETQPYRSSVIALTYLLISLTKDSPKMYLLYPCHVCLCGQHLVSKPQVLHQGLKHPASQPVSASVTSLKVYPRHSDPSHLSKASAASAILSPQISEVRAGRPLSGWPVSEWTYVVLFGWSFLNLIMWTQLNGQSGMLMENEENIIILSCWKQWGKTHVYFFLGNILYLVMLRKKVMSWFCIIIPIQYNTKEEHQDGEKVTDECVLQKISMMSWWLF